MELRAFAERVLFGADIDADKLRAPDTLQDDHPGAAVGLPCAPGRPRTMAFGGGARAPVKLATAAALEAPGARGHLLHAFANHELLALELMALALLRFPDAPRAWRMGLAATMLDEQRHLGLYLDRMRACGTGVGDVPVSAFFWRAIADAPSPLAFAARMGLVLEQANLDFALHHARLFAQVGDTETAAVLRTVYADEIRHLRHGLHWFERLRPAGGDPWAAFVDQLQPPLTPARGRGPVFDEDGRRRAGMDPGFIAEMRVARGSRGRPPAVHLFHPGVEEAVAHGGSSWRPTGAAQVFAHDLAWLPALLATEDDVVLVPTLPSLAFRTAWLRSGLPLPEAVTFGRGPAGVGPMGVDLGGRPPGPLRPWGASPAAARWLSDLGPLALPHPEVHAKTALPPLRAAVRAALGAPAWLAGPSSDGAVLDTAAAVRRHTAALLTDHASVVWKAPFSTSGRHRRRVGASGPDDAAQRFLDATMAAGQAVLVEPWLDRRLDLSVQLRVGPGERVLGWTRFETTAGGRWSGTALGTPTAGLEPAAARLLTGDGRDPRRLGRVAAALLAVLGPWLAARGHTGPVGVDLLLARTRAGLRLHPLVEINPRQTMGQLALALRPRLSPGTTGTLSLLDARELGGPPATHAGPWAARDPLGFDGRGRWTSGRMLLTDPAAARRIVAAAVLRGRATGR